MILELGEEECGRVTLAKGNGMTREQEYSSDKNRQGREQLGREEAGTFRAA